MQQPSRPLSDRRKLVEAVVASTIGTTIEWYDFFLYGAATALVFPKLFFPTTDPFISQILAFGSFTFGFVSRPIGGVIFGYLGDRFGRKSSLVATLLLMGLSTLVIGLLPTYEDIGVAAPLMLVLLRFIQGVGVGGEWGGAVLLALEYGHSGRRGFYASWPQAGVPLGLLASTGALTFFQAIMSQDAFEDWGWRLPFFLSGLLIVVGLLIRARITETPLFTQLQAADNVAKAPVTEVVRRHWREVLLVIGIRLIENASFYVYTLYILAYAKDVLKLEKGIAPTAVNIAAATAFLTIPLFGFLSDRLSRRRTYALGCVLMAVFAWPYYALLHTGDGGAIILATVVMVGLIHPILYSVEAALIPELFGTRVRYSGASIGYQLSSVFAGGLAPHIAASLIHIFPNQYWPLVAYIVAMAIISLLSVLLLAETSRKDIREH